MNTTLCFSSSSTLFLRLFLQILQSVSKKTPILCQVFHKVTCFQISIFLSGNGPLHLSLLISSSRSATALCLCYLLEVTLLHDDSCISRSYIFSSASFSRQHLSRSFTPTVRISKCTGPRHAASLQSCINHRA